jgi:hypothetical protein
MAGFVEDYVVGLREVNPNPRRWTVAGIDRFGLDLVHLRRTHFMSGSHRVYGVMRVLGVLAPNKVVRLYHRETGKLIRETRTDESGNYEFPFVTNIHQFFAIAFDTTGGQNAQVIDQITPTV